MPVFLKLPFASGRTDLPVLNISTSDSVIGGIGGLQHWFSGGFGRADANTLLDRASHMNGKVAGSALPSEFVSPRFSGGRLLDFSPSDNPRLKVPEARLKHMQPLTMIAMFELSSLANSTGQLVYTSPQGESTEVRSQIRVTPNSGGVTFWMSGNQSAAAGTIASVAVDTPYFAAFSVRYDGATRYSRTYLNSVVPVEATATIVIPETTGSPTAFGVGTQVTGNAGLRISDALAFNRYLDVAEVAKVISVLKTSYGMA